MKRYCLSVLGLFLLPAVASASVHINEISWMGTRDSTSHEWIELYNDGSEAVSLEGYVLESSNFSITLKGSIGSNGYYLIKRTSDFSEIPQGDVVASFGSGLKNSGDTIRIKDASAVIIDEVSGGDDWESIGGNNTTKDTASAKSSGWCTAIPSPKAANGGCALEETEQSGSGSQTQTASASTQSGSSSGSGSESTEVSVRPATPSLRMTGPSQVTVRSSNNFTVSVTSGDLSYVTWNFGDGTTATGYNVSHQFMVPGTSLVVLSARVGGKDMTIQKKVVVLAANVRITNALTGPDGYIQLSSRSDVDISGWSLRDGSARFDFPKGTQLVSGASAGFANTVTGLFGQKSVALFDASDRMITALGGEAVAEEKDAEYTPVISAPQKIIFKAPPLDTAKDGKVATMTISLRDSQASLAQNPYAGKLGSSSVWPYWLGLFAIISTSCAVAYFASRRLDANQAADDEAAKYTIIEMDSNLHGSAS